MGLSQLSPLLLEVQANAVVPLDILIGDNLVDTGIFPLPKSMERILAWETCAWTNKVKRAGGILIEVGAVINGAGDFAHSRGTQIIGAQIFPSPASYDCLPR